MTNKKPLPRNRGVYDRGIGYALGHGTLIIGDSPINLKKSNSFHYKGLDKSFHFFIIRRT
jgi:hypothetical protein